MYIIICRRDASVNDAVIRRYKSIIDRVPRFSIRGLDYAYSRVLAPRGNNDFRFKRETPDVVINIISIDCAYRSSVAPKLERERELLKVQSSFSNVRI